MAELITVHYRLRVAQKQRVSQFHVINRAGALPFREEPAAFNQVLNAFADGI